ncbi:hypothetical protein HELRODRAFT_84839, partial [Helobdella robusta]|uniref:Chromosome transmission fidelity protein 8 homolog n=1 Tax=Helobdella robusta TaxID=6412 RepID=T1G5P5_HELRO
EWTLVELQGDLEARSGEESLNNKFIGDLHFTKNGEPVLLVGHHILYGEIKELEKPLAVVMKCKSKPQFIKNDEQMDDTPLPHNVEYKIEAIILKKILFKSRPKPIVSNVAKKI